MRAHGRRGEVDALVPERVWQEVARGLMEAKALAHVRGAARMRRARARAARGGRLFGVPQRADYHPEIDTGVHLMMVLDMARAWTRRLPVRYACLGHDLGKGTTPADVLPRHLGHEGAASSWCGR
jgi:tRNA nucleotidyltransferase (CCA-adding enzyme)